MSIEKKLYVLKCLGEYDHVEQPSGRRVRYYRYEEEKIFYVSQNKQVFDRMVAVYKKNFPLYDFRVEVYVEFLPERRYVT